VIELRFFGGFTVEEIAEVLGIWAPSDKRTGDFAAFVLSTSSHTLPLRSSTA